MPITGDTSPEDKQLITVPERLRPFALQAGWPYPNTWTVYATNVLYGIVEDAKKLAAQQNQPDPNQPPINITIGGSGGGGGYSSGYAGMTAKDKANLKAAYMEILHSWGIPISKNMNTLMAHGIQGEWSTTNFIQHLRSTKDYKQAFPGIRKGQSEDDYLGQWDVYTSIARSHGFTLKKSQYAMLNKNQVTPQEWDMRAQFAERADRSKEFFNYLEEAARKTGMLGPREKFNERQMWEIMTGRASRPLERLVEQANTQYFLAQAGITVGQGGDLSRKQFTRYLRQAEGSGIETEYFDANTFAQLAENVRTVIPAAQQIGAGISKADLFTLETNGKGADKIARQVQDILSSWEKEKDANVNPMLIEEEGGSRLLGGGMQLPQK